MKTTPAGPEGPAYPYAIYLGSFQTEARAEKALALYAQRGLSPFWTRVDFQEKGVWYRVYSGHFRDPEEAEAFRKSHELNDAVVKKALYANLLGTYSDPAELGRRMDALRGRGYSPYVIEDREGKSRLLVGAYLTRAGAERQSRGLAEDGFEARVVLR